MPTVVAVAPVEGPCARGAVITELCDLLAAPLRPEVGSPGWPSLDYRDRIPAQGEFEPDLVAQLRGHALLAERLELSCGVDSHQVRDRHFGNRTSSEKPRARVRSAVSIAGVAVEGADLREFSAGARGLDPALYPRNPLTKGALNALSGSRMTRRPPVLERRNISC